VRRCRCAVPSLRTTIGSPGILTRPLGEIEFDHDLGGFSAADADITIGMGGSDDAYAQSVPEPSSVALRATGRLALAAVSRRRRTHGAPR